MTPCHERFTAPVIFGFNRTHGSSTSIHMNKQLLRSVALLILIPVLLGAASKNKISPEIALKRLMDGNRRFVAEAITGPHRTAERRSEVASNHAPFASILSCSDSRVPPELLFDQGFGDLFVVRNAGNIEDDIVLGSLEYGAEHLHAPLILVLGHKSCGAVTAAVHGGNHNNHIDDVVNAIEPAVEAAKEQHPGDVDAATRANARLVARRLAEKSKILSHLIESGELKILAGYYDMDTGRVKLLSDE